MIVGERCAANEQWRFQCNDRRRRTILTAFSPLPLPVAVPEACRLARIPAMGSQARRNGSHLPSNARHLVRKLRLRRIRMAIWSVEGGSDGSTQGHLGQNREASTWARRR
ncbi:prophage PSPPH01, putative transcriptional regulator [Trichinella spiralis]|uniref:prophage PSPPH01, putative transcriptional regulator n=1 Tax=Trichinella spiralis TaxID=6334 RepID=UPI0001EFC52E|nr:prophage PSPPH01, putative transcriptional regulator [Trichinella spiralis]